MKLYVDESGSITTSNNNNHRYFIIGCVETQDPYHVIRQFRKAKKEYINKHPDSKLDIKNEIKGSEMTYGMKRMIFKRIFEKTDAVFHFKVIDNHNLDDGLRVQSSLSFNYFISRIVNNVYRDTNIPSGKKLFMLIDERNQSVESLNSLDEYLRIKFTIENKQFSSVKTKYKDSGSKDLIQLADIFVNTVFRVCRNHNLFKNGMIKNIDKKNRGLINECRVGANSYFPYRANDIDICR